MDINKSTYNLKKQENREHPKFDREKIMQAWRMIFEALGEDPDREGLKGSPDRIARMYEEMFEGIAYTNDEIAEMYNTCFETSEDNDDLVTIMDIPIGSFCEHHAMPMVNMTVSVGYLPSKGRVIGLSKVARIAEICGHRLLLQERIGEDIAEVLQKILGTEHIIVVCEGEHTCMTMRGVKSRGAITRTATLKGKFKNDSDLRKEFYSLMALGDK